ncbi:RNA-binding protein [Citrifermentans bemidjiense Bem]|uniref:RNA-binding protein n=1 Tax=Citrifermentans bemidjiense (strain ATCC BAA-1014 / DSM 16622 / JCM 12645 / Bem) TaxID=404380 RepID=B5EG39_CITBB|nr:RNA-binding protein [Citrifermentans bemidjiense]ACH40952.1 RNA-binding protein [Citrifermentans bemidjiense Bem]
MAKAGKELYVGSLSYDATEYDIHKMFSVSGTVTSVHLITDAVTGEFKGCGYVRMSTEAEAKDAIDSLDGAWLLDKSIKVSYATPQKMKPGGGGAKALPKRWGKSAAEKAAAGKPAAPKAAAGKPAAPKAAAAKPAAARPAAKETAARPAGAKPAAARSAAAKPASSRPASSKPAGSRPASSRPSSAKPGSRSGKR